MFLKCPWSLQLESDVLGILVCNIALSMDEECRVKSALCRKRLKSEAARVLVTLWFEVIYEIWL